MVAFGICHHQVAPSLIGKMAKKLKCGNSLFSSSRFPPCLPRNKTTKDIPRKISVTSGVNLCDKASQASKRQPGRMFSHKTNVVPNTKEDISKNISMWRRLNNDRIWIDGWTIPLMELHASEHSHMNIYQWRRQQWCITHGKQCFQKSTLQVIAKTSGHKEERNHCRSSAVENLRVQHKGSFQLISENRLIWECEILHTSS